MHTQRPEIQHIREMIEESKWKGLHEFLTHIPVPDLSDFLEELEHSERLLLYRLMPHELASDIFAHLDIQAKDSLMESLSHEEARVLLASLDPDDRTAYLEDLPGQMIQRMTNLLSKKDLNEALQLLGYPDESIGRLMTPDYVAVRPEWTVQQALDHIRRRGRDSETINMIYVTDKQWKLLDELWLKKLILADPEQHISELMDNNFVRVFAEDDRELAVELTQHYDLYALPVVDSTGVLLGIVTVDDIIDVAEEEVTEDFQIAAAVTPLKESYKEATTFSLFSKRIFWLLGLIFVNLVASGIIAAHEDILTAVMSLVFFIPLLNAAGGNVGAQSATLVIRAQAVGEISLGQWLSVVKKELGVGLMLGTGMGLAAYASGFLYSDINVAAVVGISMFLIVVIINIIGVIFPFLLIKGGLDPAMASSPLITSVADAIGLIIYFALATKLLLP
ncbi:magnesium transporter [Nitrospirota bacterium]